MPEAKSIGVAAVLAPERRAIPAPGLVPEVADAAAANLLTSDHLPDDGRPQGADRVLWGSRPGRLLRTSRPLRWPVCCWDPRSFSVDDVSCKLAGVPAMCPNDGCQLPVVHGSR